jgi:hypothetical protein
MGRWDISRLAGQFCSTYYKRERCQIGSPANGAAVAVTGGLSSTQEAELSILITVSSPSTYH